MILTLLLPVSAVLLGACLAYYFKPETPKGMKLLLAYSGAFLLGILVLEMLPLVYSHASNTTGFWILGGILFQTMLEYFSKGAEHGHVHYHKKQFPWMILISLCIHAFLEGMPLSNELGLLWGVSIHKIPIGLVIGSMLFEKESAMTSKILALVFFALMSPLGSYTAIYFDPIALNRHISPFVLGALLHISTTILFESSEGHNFNLQKFLSILLGVGTAALL